MYTYAKYKFLIPLGIQRLFLRFREHRVDGFIANIVQINPDIRITKTNQLLVKKPKKKCKISLT